MLVVAFLRNNSLKEECMKREKKVFQNNLLHVLVSLRLPRHGFHHCNVASQSQ